MRKSMACWYSVEHRLIDRIIPALIAALAAMVVPQAAFAQTPFTAPPDVVASGNGITLLRAFSGGSIISSGPLGIVGIDNNTPVFAALGGMIDISPGSTVSHPGTVALLATDSGSRITVTGTTVNAADIGALADNEAKINILDGSTINAPIGVVAANDSGAVNGGTLKIRGSTINAETAMEGSGPGKRST